MHTTLYWGGVVSHQTKGLFLAQYSDVNHSGSHTGSQEVPEIEISTECSLQLLGSLPSPWGPISNIKNKYINRKE